MMKPYLVAFTTPIISTHGPPAPSSRKRLPIGFDRQESPACHDRKSERIEVALVHDRTPVAGALFSFGKREAFRRNGH
jgi:hypothetical protein